MSKKDATVVLTEQGKHMVISGDINSIVLPKEKTEGNYSIVEAKIFPGGGPFPHIQTREHEGFYVLEGEIMFTVDGKKILAKKGTTLNVPPGAIHSFKNETSKITRLLIIMAPGGLEGIFEEVGTEVDDISIQPKAKDESEKQKLLKASKKYGLEFV